MSDMKRRLCSCAGSAGVVLAGVYIVFMPVFAQEPAVSYDTSRVAGNFDQIRLLPPGEATPRTADGHPDLTGVTIQTKLEECCRVVTRSTEAYIGNSIPR